MADSCSFASPACCLTRHLYLRCRVDFGAQALRGTAAFTARAEREALRCLVTAGEGGGVVVAVVV